LARRCFSGSLSFAAFFSESGVCSVGSAAMSSLVSGFSYASSSRTVERRAGDCWKCESSLSESAGRDAVISTSDVASTPSSCASTCAYSA
jgi:hypothetical protein